MCYVAARKRADRTGIDNEGARQLKCFPPEPQGLPDTLYRGGNDKVTRVLLLFPPLNNVVFFGVHEPLVLEIFSAIAKEEGCEVELIDLRVDREVVNVSLSVDSFLTSSR